jgi:5-methylcytosine-specific restriction enzyme subunit McrC
VKAIVSVREFAVLTTASVSSPSLDRAHITQSAFDWLCRASAGIGLTGSELVAVADGTALRLNNYVGVLETPCGTRIEILPKTVDGPESALHSRRLLARMISTVIDVPAREVGETLLQTFDAPLSEWVIGSFLRALNRLVKRGIKHDYTRVEDTARYLSGQLDVPRQLRRHPGRLHEFEIRHDVFVPDGAENRLLKLALDHAALAAQSPENWRLAQELRLFLRDVPASRDVASDFRAWRTDRLMAHYARARPWCELVLYRRMPYSLVGEWHGISMLFPMEKLFERFVATWLARAVEPGVKMRSQASSEYLCHQNGEQMFRLSPDIVLELGTTRWILDTKWKLVDETDRANKYGLNQSDLYQLFAYGMKYLAQGGGNLVLIYPRATTFRNPLDAFDLGHGLKLHALPFDLDLLDLAGADLAGLPISSVSCVT